LATPACKLKRKERTRISQPPIHRQIPHIPHLRPTAMGRWSAFGHRDILPAKNNPSDGFAIRRQRELSFFKAVLRGQAGTVTAAIVVAQTGSFSNVILART
jgi:hypothetical protein